MDKSIIHDYPRQITRCLNGWHSIAHHVDDRYVSFAGQVNEPGEMTFDYAQIRQLREQLDDVLRVAGVK
jgi:hypothetical protein